MAIEFEQRRWSAADYEAMIAAGVLHAGHHVELLGGEIVEMPPPIGPAHGFTTSHIHLLVHARLRDRVMIRVQSTVRLDGVSMPEPDVTVLRPDPDRYRDRYAGPADILVAIEVSDSSLRHDRAKCHYYARAGVSSGDAAREAGRVPDEQASRTVDQRVSTR